MVRAHVPSSAQVRTRNWYAHRSATRSMAGRSARSKDARWYCRLTAASPPSRSSVTSAGNRNLPEEQRRLATRKIRSDKCRHNKLHRSQPHNNPVSRKNVGGRESKPPLTLLRHIVTHAEKSPAVCKMVLALPHILPLSP